MTTSKSENGGKSEETGATSCFGATSGKQDRVLGSEQQCAHAIFTSPAVNLAPYELNFQLLVRGACLLAGLESPTHALRADADPSAQSASATYITLAQEHPYDRHIEIILHLSEPHSPLVILEKGRLSFSQYEQQICSRRDFIRCTRKDSEPERKLEFVRKRHHKDILNSPVLMLNFCPDLLCEPLELHKATRELLFLIDRSGSMSAMVVALKSLPSGTMLNIVGFGTIIKPLFTSSKLCTDVSFEVLSDFQGTNLLGALSWVYQQPMQRSYPRQVFIVTDGAISNVAKVLELVRRNTCAGRCFGLGLGPRACRRLLQGVAKLTGGTTEFLDDEERLQPKLIKSLKKAFEPALTDIRIDWYLPENMEALLSPSELPPLYPGNRLIGYCTLYDMTTFKSQGRGYKGVHRGSTGSVFGQSNDELSPPPASELMPVATCADGTDLEEALREISREISSEFSCARDTDPGLETDWSSDVRRRIQESSYIQEQYVLTRCSLSSERSLQTQSHPHTQASSNSDSAGSLPQGLEKMPPPEQRSSLSRWAEPAWQQNLSAESPESVRTKVRLILPKVLLFRSTMAARSFSSPQGELEMHRLRRALERVSFDQTLGGRLDENGLMFPASPMDWDSFTDPEFLFTAVPPEDPPPGQCRSLIHGLMSGRPVSWEVTVDLAHLWTPEEKEMSGDEGCGRGGEEGRGGEPWEEIIHQLTARSVIRDFEKMAEKESDTGHAKRYRMKAIQTSKHCNIICMYTAFTITDSNPSKGLPDSKYVETTGGQKLRAFLLTESYSDCVQIPLDRLKRASPYSLHRRSLSPPFRCISPSAPSLSTSTKPPGAPSSHHVTFSPSLSVGPGHGQVDSGRGSETDVCEGSSLEPGDLQESCQMAQEDLEGSSWATAVALAWLEHRCAGYFMEWELVAAKADYWLRCQELPEGVDLAGLKGAARQLFLLLRHWDENIKLNMLCYNPNNM
uniref:von Willebrand factor A domain containing 5B2 n=1 Tax=Mastacembelus armatus TaxID=205130 RepID=A0A3Q3M199_9TELE